MLTKIKHIQQKQLIPRVNNIHFVNVGEAVVREVKMKC